MATLPAFLVQDTASPADMAVLRFQQKTAATATVNLRTETGEVYEIPAAAVVTLTAVETMVADDAIMEVTCTVTDADAGTISVPVTTTDVPTPGIYLGEFTVYDASDNVLRRFRCYVEITGAYTETQTIAPLTIAEIRAAIRDRCGEDNPLLEMTEFSDGEIIMAMRRPVDWWNETVPAGVDAYSYSAFPWRYHYLDAVVAELLKTAAYNLIRNRLPLKGGGVVSDPKARGETYLALAKDLQAQWKDWAVNKIAALNLAQFTGSVRNSDYE